MDGSSPEGVRYFRREEVVPDPDMVY